MNSSDTVSRYIHWIIKWRWLVLLFAVLFLGACIHGKSRLMFTSDYRVFFKKDNLELSTYDELQKEYTKTDNILFVLQSSSYDVITPEMLSIVHDMTARAWKIPYSIRVESITNFQHTTANGDLLRIQDLVTNPNALKIEELSQIRKVIYKEPSLVNRLIDESGKTTGIFITLQMPDEDPLATGKTVAYAEKLADEIQTKNPDLRIAVTGLSPLVNAYTRAAKQDMNFLVPLMYGIIILLMLVFLRSIWGTLVTLFIVKMSSDAAMGVAGWISMKLTAPLATVPVIVMSIAVADCLHIILTAFYYMQESRSKQDAIKESFRVNMKPVILTSLTTAIGFLGLNFSASPPFHDLGNITAIGICIAYFLSITFLPAAFSLIPFTQRFLSRHNFVLINRLSRFTIVNRNKLLWVISILVIGFTALVPLNKIDDHVIEYFDRSFQERIDSEFTLENLTGIYQLEFSIESGKPFNIADYAYLSKLEAFTKWLRNQPEVIHVNSFTDIIKRLNKSMHGDDERFYSLPKDKEMTSQYLLSYEMSLPYGLDLSSQLDINRSATRLVVTLDRISTQEIIKIKNRAEKWLEENNLSRENKTGTGLVVVMSYITHHNINSMLWGTAISFFLITLTMVLSLKSVRLGLISLIPNILPIGVAFGIWGLLDGNISTPVANVTVICVGIIVDDTVHILNKFSQAVKQMNMTPEKAMHHSLSTAGPAIWMTSLLLTVGFMVLNFSPFKMNSEMGLLSAIVILIALILDFFFLPGIIIFIYKKGFFQKKIQTKGLAKDPMLIPVKNKG